MKLTVADVIALSTAAGMGLAVVALVVGALVVAIDGLWGVVVG